MKQQDLIILESVSLCFSESRYGANHSLLQAPGSSRCGHDRQWGDTPVQPQSERDTCFSARKPLQAMGAAVCREPTGGCDTRGADTLSAV